MPKIVRSSKFRHAFGQAWKRQECYEDIRVTKSSWDSNFCDVNPKFLAIVTESAGGGAFIVLPLTKVGRLPVEYPLVAGHKASILDIAWCPHNDHIIASASEDCSVKIWEIPQKGLTVTITEPVVNLPAAHQRRACHVRWHPSAADIMMTAGADCKVFIWDISQGRMLVSMNYDQPHPEIIMSIAWSYNGSRVLTTCRDRNTRLFDARTGKLVRAAKGHDSVKPMRGMFLKDGKILTTGFSKMSLRQYALWDLEKSDQPLIIEDMDTSNGVMYPFYDPDTNMIYLEGKGDSTIRYFEYTPETSSIHYISAFTSSEPQRGAGFMPKRGMDFSKCEIARFYKLHNTGLCEVISFCVPRKSDLFQKDLYPDTATESAAISSTEWFDDGIDADPKLVAIEQTGTVSHGDVASKTTMLARPNMPKRSATVKASFSHSTRQPLEDNGSNTVGKACCSDCSVLIGKLMGELATLKSRVTELEKTIHNASI